MYKLHRRMQTEEIVINSSQKGSNFYRSGAGWGIGSRVKVIPYVKRPFNHSSLPHTATTNKGAAAVASINQERSLDSHRTHHGCHWRIQGVPLACTPPTGLISFIFAYVFTKKCTRRRLAPPNGSAPPQREILDPPLDVIWSKRRRCLYFVR